MLQTHRPSPSPQSAASVVKTELKTFPSIWGALDLSFEETQNLRLKSYLTMTLAEKIKLECAKHGLSQTALAKKYKLSQSVLSWIVTGKLERFSVTSLLTVANGFGMKIDITIT